MKAMKWLTFVSAAALFVAGCSDDADKPAAAGKTASAPRTVVFKSPLNPAIKPEAAIAVVNGTAITRADYDRWIALRTRVYCLANGIDPYKPDKKVAKYNSANANLAFIDIVRRELIRQECEKKGITASESDIKIMQKRFMKGIKKQNEPFDAYCASLPQSEGDEIRRQVMADALGETYLTKWATNDIHHVSAQEVSNRLEYVENYQKSVDKMNEEAKKRAAEAKAEILAGASFYSVTTNRAEIFKDEGKEWDVLCSSSSPRRRRATSPIRSTSMMESGSWEFWTGLPASRLTTPRQRPTSIRSSGACSTRTSRLTSPRISKACANSCSIRRFPTRARR